ncbi:MAG: amino acid adenylation domain-containing protein [Pseudomonadota bacterium]
MSACLYSPHAHPTEPAPAAAPCALSLTQQAILLRQELLGSAIYTIGLTVHIEGDIDPALLERATQDVIAAEPMLRARIEQSPEGPRWHYAPTLSWRLPVIDCAAQTETSEQATECAERAIAAVKDRGIDPMGDTLWHFVLYRLAPARWAWLLSFNHLLVDGWGVLLVGEAIRQRYDDLAQGAAPALAPGADYARFVSREQAYLKSERHARDRAFWGERLAHSAATGHASAPVPQVLAAPALMRWNPDPGAWQRYVERAAAEGLSAAQAVLFMLGTYIALITGQDRVRLGMPLHNRKDAIDKRTLGVFANTLPVELDSAPLTSLHQGMRALAEDTRQVLRHQQYPLDDAIARLPPRQGVPGMHFDLMVSVEDFGKHATLGAARLSFAPFSGHPGFAPIAAYVRHYADAPIAPIDFVIDPRAPAALRHTRFLRERLDHLLQQLAGDAQGTFANLDLLSPAELAALNALQPAPQPRPNPQCLHALVAEQARRTAQACAVRFSASELSYEALERAANRLAHALRAQGVGRDVCVPVLMERRPQLVVALLAVLKAGGTYVPLDAELPAERVRAIVWQTGARVLLAAQAQHAALREALADADLQIFDADLASGGPAAPPEVVNTPDDLAVVIFTSGSTGQPKGVMLSHRALCNHKLWNARAVDFGPHDRLLQKSSLSFDASVSEFFVPLICGAAVHLAPPGLQCDLHALLQYVIDEGITHLTLAPSTARALADDPLLPRCTSLRYLQFGGEPLDAALAAHFQALLPQTRLLNFYGPSETTEDSALYVVEGPITQSGGSLPVGRPIDNTRIHVLDARLRPLPFDVVGEVCIAGLGVARGYLGQPELTAARFIPDPLHTGSRMFRSGDLGYWSQDGQLHILGRSDDQIKLRGFRIELGDIEAALLRHPAVAQAAVTVWTAASGEPSLAAYLVLREEHDGTVLASVRQALKDSLPHYMVPAAWQILPRLPLTASGKLDKRQLPVPQVLAQAAATVESTPPRTPTEHTLWAIWSEVLHTTDFGIGDHFFDLGGHSLTLTQVRSRIQARFDLELPLAALFTHLTLESLARHIDERLHEARQQASIPMADRSGDLPASLSQRRMWVIQHFHPETLAYNVTAPLRLRGPLDLPTFERALAKLVARHEGLRTQFALRGQEPVQVILPSVAPGLDILDFRHLPADARLAAARQAATAFLARPFDLARAPLHRLCLMRLSEDDHVLFWVLHHTIADNWSLAILGREAMQIYAGLLQGKTDAANMGLPPLPLQYADYAAWQRSAAAAAAREAQLDYWMQRLQGLADLPLPTDFPRPSQPSFQGRTVHAPLSEPLRLALRGYCAAQGVTPFMLLLASFDVLLARITRSSDIAVGTPIANRHHAATEQLVGTLVNTLVLRNRVDLDQSFHDLVQQVRDTALQAYAHQDAPFDELVERMDALRADHPQGLVRVLFNVLNAPLGQAVAVPFTYEPFDFDRVAAQFDLSLHIDTEFSHRIQLEYATDLFSTDSAQRLLDGYVQLTEQLLSQPQAPLGAHPLITAPQRALLDSWNATQAPPPPARNLPDYLRLDAPERHDRLAVTDASGRSLRYPELHARALQIAGLLQHAGVGRGDRVGLCLHRHADMLAALLAVLHTGAAYVPLDPGFPPARLHHMATDAELRCILTETDLLPLLAATGVPQIALDAAADAPAFAPDPAHAPRPEDPAYILYTSGSTGRPKGVVVPHRAVINFLHSMAGEPGLKADDALLAVTTLSFDIAVLELLLPLAAGARVVLADHAQSRVPYALRDLLRGSGASVMQATPSTWRMLLDTGWRGGPGLRAFIGGEALPADLAPRLLAACAEVWNLYGPTETTVWSTCWRAQPQQPIVIGRPIANTQVWVLDPRGQLCPIGVPGEIHIGGAGVTLGYFQRPELTAERFIPDPFSVDAQARLYKTGDLGRWRHDGQLEYLGRLDHQIKIRGYRVELGEIEAALREQTGVADCVLTTHAPTPDDVRLVAYIVPAPGVAAASAADLRRSLRARLPDYMVPQHIVPLPALPLLPNGKLDRTALPAPQPDAPDRMADTRAAEQPATPQERLIAAIWRELLGVDQVLRTDNFFDLGGHSLLAMRAVLAIEQQLGWRLAPRRLIFENLGQIARSAPSRIDAA